jgi:putative endonuclease
MSQRYPYIATYIMASRPLGVIYIGATSDLPRRVYEHREGLIDGFTKTYGCKMLVWYEPHQMIATAIRRERTMKHWNRVWKLELIERMNPDWRDLYATFNQ